MSSLAVSLLLLIVLAVAVALVYNLQQSSRTGLKWPAWLRLPQGGRAARGAGDEAMPRAGSTAGRAPASPSASRGEPRLAITETVDEAPHGHVVPDETSARPALRMPDESRAPAQGRARDDEPSGVAHDAVDHPRAGAVQARAAPAGQPEALAGVAAGVASGATSEPGVTPQVGVSSGMGVTSDADTCAVGDSPAAVSSAHRAHDPAPAAAAFGGTPAGTGAEGIQAVLSEVFDCIIEMPLPSACSGERLLAFTQRFRRAGAKPVAVEGRIAGAAAHEWSTLAPVHQYDALRLGILMANRHGALNAMEYSEFVAGVQAIADALTASADVPDMAAVLARARDLDATCAQLDAQVGVNVEAPEALGPAQLAALAGLLSVVERGSNRYARLGLQGEVVFSVALADVPNRLTFLLDVPRSSPAWDAWNRMVEAATACARRLGGRIVDDGGRALADASLAQIGRQLSQRYESLEAIGVPAGSALALRVFN